MTHVLVLRPQPGADATVERARALGLEAIAIPLFEAEAVGWDAPETGAFDGLLLTSANAVRMGGEGLKALRALPVYAVGGATAEAAREAGFDIVATGDAGVDRLLASIEPELKLLHLCGADRRKPENGERQIAPVIVYRARPIEAPDLSATPGSIALIHSPSAGRRFSSLITDRGSIGIAAISDAAAQAAGDGWRTVAIAAQPNDDALLALAARLCDKPDPK